MIREAVRASHSIINLIIILKLCIANYPQSEKLIWESYILVVCYLYTKLYVSFCITSYRNWGIVIGNWIRICDIIYLIDYISSKSESWCEECDRLCEYYIEVILAYVCYIVWVNLNLASIRVIIYPRGQVEFVMQGDWDVDLSTWIC